MKVVIVGGGFGGLTAGLELARHGVEVVLYEREKDLGGLARGFPTAGTFLDNFYHHIFTTDKDFQRLMTELNMADRLLWLNPRMGMFYAGRIWNFGLPMDLLRFKPLNFISKIRFGLSILYLQRVRRWRAYERVTAISWLRKYAGKQVCDVVWEPLLRAKFGDQFEKISMAWMWARLTTRAGSRKDGKEALGYIQGGGFMAVINAAGEELRRLGGRIQTDVAVEKILLKDGKAAGVVAGGHEEAADAVLCTTAPSILLKLLPDAPAEFRSACPSVQYFGAMCLVLRLNQSLSHIYWMNISDPSIPITSVVEHTNFMEKGQYQGNVYLYLGNYLPHGHKYFAMNADRLLDEFFPHVKKIFPSFERSMVLEKWVFKEAFAQPIVETGYGKRIPPIKTAVPGLFHISMAQVYPEDRGTNFAIKFGYDVARMILDEKP